MVDISLDIIDLSPANSDVEQPCYQLTNGSWRSH